jgi:hypothetical protein
MSSCDRGEAGACGDGACGGKICGVSQWGEKTRDGTESHSRHLRRTLMDGRNVKLVRRRRFHVHAGSKLRTCLQHEPTWNAGM